MPEYAYVHNNEAEQAVLAACILNEEAAREIVAALEPEDFFRIVNGIIFDAAKTILSEGKPLDAVVLAHRLDARGKLGEPVIRSYLLDLCDQTFSLLAWREHLRIVRECSLQRKILNAALMVAAESSRAQEDFDDYLSSSKERLRGALPPEPALASIGA